MVYVRRRAQSTTNSFTCEYYLKIGQRRRTESIPPLVTYIYMHSSTYACITSSHACFMYAYILLPFQIFLFCIVLSFSCFKDQFGFSSNSYEQAIGISGDSTHVDRCGRRRTSRPAAAHDMQTYLQHGWLRLNRDDEKQLDPWRHPHSPTTRDKRWLDENDVYHYTLRKVYVLVAH